MSILRLLAKAWHHATRPRLRLRLVDEEPGRPTPGLLYIVGTREMPKWAIFECPCGCSDRIELYLGSRADPRWKASFNRRGTTLKPSVSQTGGCGAHFFVRDGRVDFV